MAQRTNERCANKSLNWCCSANLPSVFRTLWRWAAVPKLDAWILLIVQYMLYNIGNLSFNRETSKIAWLAAWVSFRSVTCHWQSAHHSVKICLYMYTTHTCSNLTWLWAGWRSLGRCQVAGYSEWRANLSMLSADQWPIVSNWSEFFSGTYTCVCRS